jgi:hypothetical protein
LKYSLSKIVYRRHERRQLPRRKRRGGSKNVKAAKIEARHRGAGDLPAGAMMRYIETVTLSIPKSF